MSLERPLQATNNSEKLVSHSEVIEAVTDYGSVVEHEGVQYAITSDGERGVPIPTPMAERISVMFRLQEKVLNELGVDDDAKHVFQTFNCRKSVLVAAGDIDFVESAVDLSNDSGEGHMFEDVVRITGVEHGSVAVLRDYGDFENVLDSYKGAFPCTVHVFESDEELPVSDLVTNIDSLHRVHSFLVLGEDDEGYICFQKMGPGLHEPFTISDLTLITHLYRNQKNRVGYFVYGPYK